MDKRTERLINRLYEETFKKIFTVERMTKASRGKTEVIRSTVLSLQASEQYNEFAEKFAKKLASAGLSRQKGVWRKYFEAAKAKHYVALPNTYSAFEKKMLKEVVEKNFKMIKSIPESIMKVYEQEGVKTVMKEVIEGSVGRKAFETSLKKHAIKNAKMIARTEAAKLQTSIDEHRATSLGSVCYQWMSSKDKRTRKSHREMNGVVVFWRPDEQKPLLDKMRGNAGEFPNCRCTTMPILDENDLTSSSYKVYDYRIDKIVSMSKADLLEAIEKGEL